VNASVNAATPRTRVYSNPPFVGRGVPAFVLRARSPGKSVFSGRKVSEIYSKKG